MKEARPPWAAEPGMQTPRQGRHHSRVAECRWFDDFVTWESQDPRAFSPSTFKKNFLVSENNFPFSIKSMLKGLNI